MVCCRPICVAGAFVTTAEPVEVIPPGNDRRPIAVTYHALEAEYEQAVEGALAAEEPLAALVAYERSAALHAVSRGILDRADELSRQLATEAGKADSRCAHRGRARCPHVPPRRRRGAPHCVEPINPPIRDAGLKAPSRLLRPTSAASCTR